MNKIKYIVAAIGMAGLFGLSGCEDPRTQYLDEYDTLVYFRNGGEQEITLFSVGNDARYSIPVCKGGSVSDAEADVRIVPMDQSQLDIYNMKNETKFVQIPEDCYRFTDDLHLHFSASDRYRVVEVELKTDKIRERQEAAGDGVQYVLGLQLYSGQKVSDGINRLILKPEIDVPVVSFTAAAADLYRFSPDSPEENVLSSTLSVNMPASSVEWAFDCTVLPLDQEWLDAYNAENETEYALLPAANYTLPEKIHFEAGKATAPFELIVKRNGFEPFEFFALPIKLATCSKPELKIDETSVYLAVVVLEPAMERIPLTTEMLTVPSSYTATNDGGGVPALVDGDTNTYWHSTWSTSIVGDETYGVYIDIALDSPLNVVRFTYWVRHNNNNGAPQIIRVGVSNDGETWDLLGEVSSGLPAAAGDSGELPTMYRYESFKYVRFAIVKSALGDLRGSTDASTALGELVLEGGIL